MFYLFRLFGVLALFSGFADAQFLIDSFPADGAKNVPRNTRIGLAFRGSIVEYNFPMTLRKPGATVPVQASFVGSGASDPQFPSMVWRPFVALEANTAYDVEYFGANGRQLVRFTTGADVDTTAAKVVSIEPKDGATAIDPFAPIVVTFDKPMSGSEGGTLRLIGAANESIS